MASTSTDNEVADVDWKEFQIYEGAAGGASSANDEGEEDEYHTYMTHNLFEKQDDVDDEEYYEEYEYPLTQKTAPYTNKSSIMIRHHDATANSTGLGLWTGAELLCGYLQDPALPNLLEGKSVVELGAGVGLCGLVAHALGASHVTMTDGDSVVLGNARFNVKENVASDSDRAVECKQLIWGTQQAEKFLKEYCKDIDIVMASDCVYMPKSLVPLWETVSTLLRVPNQEEQVPADQEGRNYGPGFFIFVNVSSSQAPFERVLETAEKFRFEREIVAPNVNVFRPLL